MGIHRSATRPLRLSGAGFDDEWPTVATESARSREFGRLTSSLLASIFVADEVKEDVGLTDSPLCDCWFQKSVASFPTRRGDPEEQGEAMEGFQRPVGNFSDDPSRSETGEFFTATFFSHEDVISTASGETEIEAVDAREELAYGLTTVGIFDDEISVDSAFNSELDNGALSVGEARGEIPCAVVIRSGTNFRGEVASSTREKGEERSGFHRSVTIGEGLL